MTKMRLVKIQGICTCCLAMIPVQLLAAIEEPNPVWHETFTGQIIIPVIGAAVGFLFAYILNEINRRRQPRKQISYDIVTTAGTSSPEKGMPDKVVIHYNGKAVSDLHYVSCRIENTGNTIVKDQEVRFCLAEGDEFVDTYFGHDPIPELKARKIESDSKNVKYAIGHLEKGDFVDIELVATGPHGARIDVIPFNEAGNVSFVPRSMKQAEDDTYHGRRFILIFTLLWVLPQLGIGLPEEVGFIFSGVIRFVLVALLIPHIPPFSNLVLAALRRLGTASRVDSTIEMREIQADKVSIVSTSHDERP